MSLLQQQFPNRRENKGKDDLSPSHKNYGMK